MYLCQVRYETMSPVRPINEVPVCTLYAHTKQEPPLSSEPAGLPNIIRMQSDSGSSEIGSASIEVFNIELGGSTFQSIS